MLDMYDTIVVNPYMTMSELGMDSLDFFDIDQRMCKKLDMSEGVFGEHVISPSDTVIDLVDVVSEHVENNHIKIK